MYRMSEPWTREEWPALHGQDRPGWVSKLLAPEATRRARTVPFTLTALGAVAFVISLVLGWQVVAIHPVSQSGDGDGASTATQTITSSLGGIDTLSTVYVFGVIALLAVASGLSARADLAARYRWAVGGGIVGLVGLLVAITIRIPHSVWPLERAYGVFIGSLDQLGPDRYDISYGPGLFAGYFAVVLPAAAIWVTAHRHDQLAAAGAARHVPTPELAAYVPGQHAHSPNGASPTGPDDPSSGYRPPPAQAGPRDLTVTPD